MTREHNDTNVIAFGAQRYDDPVRAKGMLDIWLGTRDFSHGERHDAPNP